MATKKRGRPPTQNGRRITTISLDPSMYDDIASLAHTLGVSRSAILRAAWRKYARGFDGLVRK